MQFIIKNKLTTIMLIMASFLLNACASSSFDCPNRAGVMCKSLDQVNDMVDDGEIRGRTQQVSQIKTNEKTQNQNNSSSDSASDFEPYSIANGYYPGAPLRYGETVQRVWVAPYEDTENNYHDASLIYTIVKEGHWIGSPIKVDAES